jgi:hypothetical protein
MGAVSGAEAMKRIAPNYHSGEVALLEAPRPASRPDGVLVRLRQLPSKAKSFQRAANGRRMRAYVWLPEFGARWR